MFSCEYYEIFTNSLFTDLLQWLLLYYFKNNWTAISQRLFSKKCLCCNALLILSSHHVLERQVVWCIKSRTSLFANLSSIFRFSKQLHLHQGILYKAENWHALSHEQNFSKHNYLDHSQNAFNQFWNEKL